MDKKDLLELLRNCSQGYFTSLQEIISPKGVREYQREKFAVDRDTDFNIIRNRVDSNWKVVEDTQQPSLYYLLSNSIRAEGIFETTAMLRIQDHIAFLWEPNTDLWIPKGSPAYGLGFSASKVNNINNINIARGLLTSSIYECFIGYRFLENLDFEHSTFQDSLRPWLYCYNSKSYLSLSPEFLLPFGYNIKYGYPEFLIVRLRQRNIVELEVKSTYFPRRLTDAFVHLKAAVRLDNLEYIEFDLKEEWESKK